MNAALSIQRPRPDEAWFYAHVARYRGATDEALPGFPPDALQRNTTGRVGEATLREAFVFYQDCLRTFGESGLFLSRASRVLDFGVGWGRITRFFLREVDKANLFGIDVDPELIDVCKKTFDSENFSTCNALPPTHFAEGQLDAVVGYSVFSHLSEAACERWMLEFHRILRPGGMLALTTRGRFFFDYCESLRGSPDHYGRSLALMFDDFSSAKARYDAGHFVHSARFGLAGGARNPDYYGETFIPRSYATKAWSQLFRFVLFLNDAPGKHPTMFFERKR